MKTRIAKIKLFISSRQFIGVLSSCASVKASFLEQIRNQENAAYFSKEVSLNGDLTVGDFLKFQACFYSTYSSFEESHLLEVFNILRTSKLEHLTPEERHKTFIVSSLSSKPKLILIDEMTEALSRRTRAIFFKELERFKKSYGSTIILVTNAVEVLLLPLDNIILIDQSGVSFQERNDSFERVA